MTEVITTLESTTQIPAALAENVQVITDSLRFISTFIVLLVIVGLCAGLWWLLNKVFCIGGA